MLSISNGLHAVLKRRNSKVNRESVRARSSLTLPGAVRRFASTEALTSQSQGNSSSEVATVTRRRSFSRRLQKTSTGMNPPEASDSCLELDINIAKIKRKLAEFRKEDIEISERVEDLTNSLTGLCHDYRISISPITSLPQKRPHHPSSSCSNTDSEDDEEEFKKFCQNHRNLYRNPTIFVDDGKHNTLPASHLNHHDREERMTTTSSNITASSFLPRNSYPQDCHYRSSAYRPISHHSCPSSRPFSYQEISEHDYEESPPLQEKLSCP